MYPFDPCFSLNMYPGGGLLDHNSNSIFGVLRNLHTVFLKCDTNSHSQKQCRRVLFSPRLLQHLLFVDFLMLAILTDMMWYGSFVCISLIIINVEIFSCASWPSVCLLWRNVYLGLLLIFWWDSLFLMVLSLMSCLFWKLIPVHCFICYCFVPFWRLSFHLAYISFVVWKLLSLIRSRLFVFAFISFTLGGES